MKNEDLKSKIKLAGIDHVKNEIKAGHLKKNVHIQTGDNSSVQINHGRSSSSSKIATRAPTTEMSMIKKILIGLAITVGAALILWFGFGIRPN